MGTSSSGTGPKGRSPLLPSWATEEDMPTEDGDQNQDTESIDDDQEEPDSVTRRSNDYADTLAPSKGAIRRVVNGKSGATFKKAAKNYIRRIGGTKNATRSSSAGISAGGNYISFIGGVASVGFEKTMRDFGLDDYIGKSTEEVFARIANKIAPTGSTNDEAIARSAVMLAFDRLCKRLIENDQDLSMLDQLDEITLKDTVIEFVSAYIFKKWVYEAGLALERNELSESDAIELEKEMHDFVGGEVRSSLKNMDLGSLDLEQGKGKDVIENIFELAYSTLEK